MTALLLSCIFSERLICETANNSRHFRMVAPGLLEKIISPAILRAKTSRILGETDKRFPRASTCARCIKRYRFPRTPLAFKLLKADAVNVNREENEREDYALSFKQRMEENSRNRKTDIVLALDFPYQNPESRTALLAKAQEVLEAVHPYVCAV